MTKRTFAARIALAAIALCMLGAVAPAQDFNTALDQPWLTFATGGNVGWSVDSASAAPGGGASSARSGAITNNQQSSLSVSVTGPATMTFYWKISCESGFDGMFTYLDGASQGLITGTVDWTQKTVNIPTGTHQIEWRYVKDESGSSGQDAGWVDLVQVNPLLNVNSIEFTVQQASVMVSQVNYDFWVLDYNYASDTLLWNGGYNGSNTSLQVVPYDMAQGQWHGLFSYDVTNAAYTAAQYNYRDVLGSNIVTDASTAIPNWAAETLDGSPSSALSFSGSSSLCGINVPTGQSGNVLFYNYGTDTPQWSQTVFSGTTPIEYMPAGLGDWTGIFIYNTTAGQYEEDAMYMMQNKLN